MTTLAANPGALAAVFLVDILNDLLAPLVLEIDIDVGRLVARVGDEALEEEIVNVGIDLGNPEAIADDGIGRRAAPLRENAVVAGKAHDVIDGEKVSRIFFRRDEVEFPSDGLFDFFRHALRIASRGALADQSFERFLLACIAGAQFIRIIILQLVERELDAIEKADCLGECMR